MDNQNYFFQLLMQDKTKEEIIEELKGVIKTLTIHNKETWCEGDSDFTLDWRPMNKINYDYSKLENINANGLCNDVIGLSEVIFTVVSSEDDSDSHTDDPIGCDDFGRLGDE